MEIRYVSLFKNKRGVYIIKNRVSIDIEELVELKEKGLKDREISNFFILQGRKIRVSTVSQRLYRYYRAQGMQKPRAKAGRQRKELPIEEIVKLKEKGLSGRKIVEHLKSQGIDANEKIVCKRLTEYYQMKGDVKPRAKKNKDITEELVRLREQGLSNTKISAELVQQGVHISHQTVNNRLTEYYKSQGIDKPRARIALDISKLIRLREQGMTYKNITKYYYAKSGRKISEATIRTRIVEICNGQDSEQKQSDYIQICRPEIKYNDDIKSILMNGMTIDEFVTETGKNAEETKLEIKLRKLEFLAGYSEISERTMGM